MHKLTCSPFIFGVALMGVLMLIASCGL